MSAASEREPFTGTYTCLNCACQWRWFTICKTDVFGDVNCWQSFRQITWCETSCLGPLTAGQWSC